MIEHYFPPSSGASLDSDFVVEKYTKTGLILGILDLFPDSLSSVRLWPFSLGNVKVAIQACAIWRILWLFFTLETQRSFLCCCGYESQLLTILNIKT